MICFPNVKINLGLFVTGKRPDGYHNIESIFVPVPWREVLEVVPAAQKSNASDAVNLHVHGAEIPGNPADNIILKTARALSQIRQVPALDVHLLKKLPMGAGLGGGSANAAFALRAMNDFLEHPLSDDEALKVLASVGSDCPFFWKNQCAFVSGRGELMEEVDLDLSGFYILLVNPGIHISTAEAYAGVNIISEPPIDLRKLGGHPSEGWKGLVENSFEKGIFERYPEIEAMKSHMYDMGAVYASMTGSGSTVYGMFKSMPELPESWQHFQHWAGSLS